MTPEERAAWEAQKAEWARQRKELEELFARKFAEWDEAAERHARRRRLVRRLIPFLNASLA
jgi:hypothetical protein